MSSVHRNNDGSYNVNIARGDETQVLEVVLETLLNNGLIESYKLPFDWGGSHEDADGRVYPYL